jgi:hypothetical protein
MCHHVQVTLSAEDKAAAKKMAGFMMPVYASILLAVVALLAFTADPRPGELIASASAPAAQQR